MIITLTGINFNYTNGYDAGYDSVNLSSNTSGATFNISGFVQVTKDEYVTTMGDPVALTELIRTSMISNITNMAITLTGINFNYINGYDAGYDSVNLSANSSGTTSNISGYVQVTRDEYLGAMGDPVALSELIRTTIISSLTIEN